MPTKLKAEEVKGVLEQSGLSVHGWDKNQREVVLLYEPNDELPYVVMTYDNEDSFEILDEALAYFNSQCLTDEEPMSDK